MSALMVSAVLWICPLLPSAAQAEAGRPPDPPPQPPQGRNSKKQEGGGRGSGTSERNAPAAGRRRRVRLTLRAVDRSVGGHACRRRQAMIPQEVVEALPQGPIRTAKDM